MPTEPATMHDAEHTFLLAALERYERPLIRYAHSFTSDIEEARDVVQDVFIKLSQNASSIDPPRLAAWLFTVCKNRALDHQRKHSRLIVMETESFDLEVSPSPRPGDEMESRETAATLRGLIEKLPTRQREAVTLKFMSGLDYKEISQVMKTSIGNVGYLIHHGVQALRTQWQLLEAEPQSTACAH